MRKNVKLLLILSVSLVVCASGAAAETLAAAIYEVYSLSHDRDSTGQPRDIAWVRGKPYGEGPNQTIELFTISLPRGPVATPCFEALEKHFFNSQTNNKHDGSLISLNVSGAGSTLPPGLDVPYLALTLKRVSGCSLVANKHDNWTSQP